MKDHLKYQIYINTVPITGDTTDESFITGNTTNIGIRSKYGIYSKNDNTVKEFNDNDFFVNVPLYKKNKIEEYIDKKREQAIEFIDDTRQQFNPYYIEFGFFDTIKSNKLIKGASFPLTNDQTDYIKSVRTDLATATPPIVMQADVTTWFINYGQYELPWVVASGTIVLDDITSIEKGSLNTTQINYIRQVRPDIDVAFNTDYKILIWFSEIGFDSLPWNGTITIDDVTKSSSRNDMIISKANTFPIDINS